MQATSAQHVTEDNVLDFKETGILEDVEIGSEADRSIRIEKIFKYVYCFTTTSMAAVYYFH